LIRAQVKAEHCEGNTAADWAAKEARAEAETLLRKLEAIETAAVNVAEAVISIP
jgi:hypothetical protein